MNGEFYKSMVDRVMEYRKNLGNTQEDFGIVLGVSQGHFSKIEHEKVKISGESLQRLLYYSKDIDYFFTENHKVQTELDERIMSCPRELRYEFLQLAIWLLNRGLYNSGLATYDDKKELRYLSLWSDYNFSANAVWFCIRKASDLTQEVFAAKLGISSKKYRSIEHNNAMNCVDAEILANLFVETGFYPSLTMRNELAILSDVNRMWEKLPDDIRDMLLEKLDLLMPLLK